MTRWFRRGGDRQAPASLRLEESEALVDEYVEDLAELIALDENGEHSPGSLTLVWKRADGTGAMMTVTPSVPGRRASLDDEEALAGLATGGRAAAIFDWGVSETQGERAARQDEEYEVVALVGPFRAEDGMSGKLAVFRLLVSRRDQLRIEVGEVEDERRRDLITSAVPALNAMTGFGV